MLVIYNIQYALYSSKPTFNLSESIDNVFFVCWEDIAYVMRVFGAKNYVAKLSKMASEGRINIAMTSQSMGKYNYWVSILGT